MNTLRILSNLKSLSKKELEAEAKKKNISIAGGLGTWKKLGIVTKCKEGKQDKYFIIDSLRDTVKKELKKISL